MGLCRARTGESPSQRPSDPLSLLLLTTLAPPMVSALTGSDLLLSPPVLLLLLLPTVLLAMALLEELPMELPLEECSTDTLATTELPSSTLPLPVEYLELSKIASRHQEKLASNFQN